MLAPLAPDEACRWCELRRKSFPSILSSRSSPSVEDSGASSQSTFDLCAVMKVDAAFPALTFPACWISTSPVSRGCSLVLSAGGCSSVAALPAGGAGLNPASACFPTGSRNPVPPLIAAAATFWDFWLRLICSLQTRRANFSLSPLSVLRRIHPFFPSSAPTCTSESIFRCSAFDAASVRGSPARCERLILVTQTSTPADG